MTSTYTAFDDLFDCFRYPAGETHLQLRTANVPDGPLTIEMPIRSFEGVGQLRTADAILKRNDVEATWFVPYFPFARHDRRNHCGDGFELGIALDMVRDLDITIADPHSDVAGQLRHFTQTASVQCFRDGGGFASNQVVVVPDAGATKKAHDWCPGAFVQALKHRDPATGKLSGFEVLANDLEQAPCLIVDDICDGGGTFQGLAAELRAKNAGPLTLAVTHGLFTKGTDELCQSFERIITFGFIHGARLPGVEYLPFHDLYNQGVAQ